MSEAANPQGAPAPATDPKSEPPKSETRELLRFVAMLAAILFVLRAFVFAFYSIPSESMMPRLLKGDYLFVSKWNYGYSRASIPFGLPLIPGQILARLPDRGDIAVFKSPATGEDYIKRVIGLPGDRIQVREGRLFLNGKEVERKRVVDYVLAAKPNTPCMGPQFAETGGDGQPRCRYPQYHETLPNGRSYNTLDLGTTTGDDTPEYVVPPDHLFMMGDDRDNSADSRFDAAAGRGIGYVPTRNLVGRARFVCFSTNGDGNWYQPWTWFEGIRWDRIGHGL